MIISPFFSFSISNHFLKNNIFPCVVQYELTSFAQNCRGGGSAPDQNWGCDKNEDDILWTRRCFRKAREMITTPVIRRGMRR